jgi:hypothetical protein
MKEFCNTIEMRIRTTRVCESNAFKKKTTNKHRKLFTRDCLVCDGLRGARKKKQASGFESQSINQSHFSSLTQQSRGTCSLGSTDSRQGIRATNSHAKKKSTNNND